MIFVCNLLLLMSFYEHEHCCCRILGTLHLRSLSVVSCFNQSDIPSKTEDFYINWEKIEKKHFHIQPGKKIGEGIVPLDLRNLIISLLEAFNFSQSCN